MAHKMTYRTDLQQQEILFTEKKRKKVLTKKRKEYIHDFTANGFSLLFLCYTLFEDLSVSHVTFYKGASKVKHCRVGWVAVV